MYTAPAKKPTPNVAWVRLDVDFEAWTSETGVVTKFSRSFAARITIVDRGYRPTGTGGTLDPTVSGVICSLEKPFTVNGTSPTTVGAFQHFYKFVPSSATSGTVTMIGKGPIWTAEYAGKYTIEGADTDKPRIVLTLSGSGTMKGAGTASSTETGHIDLAPLETDECN